MDAVAVDFAYVKVLFYFGDMGVLDAVFGGERAESVRPFRTDGGRNPLGDCKDQTLAAQGKSSKGGGVRRAGRPKTYKRRPRLCRLLALGEHPARSSRRIVQ